VLGLSIVLTVPLPMLINNLLRQLVDSHFQRFAICLGAERWNPPMLFRRGRQADLRVSRFVQAKRSDVSVPVRHHFD